jgi:hypothetical protein
MPDVDVDGEGRRLLRAAAADITPGDDLLTSFRAAQTARTARAPRRRRARFAVSLGTAGALGAGAFATVTAVTVTPAPSTYAAVTAATNETCSQTFRIAIASSSGGARSTGTGEFDVPDGVAEESFGPWIAEVTGGRMYLHVPKGGLGIPTDGKPWVGQTQALRPAQVRQLFKEGAGLRVPGFDLSPCGDRSWSDLFQPNVTLKSAGVVSGPGWIGTRYTLSVPKRGLISAAIDIDQQGRLRYLDFVVAGSPQVTLTVAFSDFGAPVSVSPPPPSEVYLLPGSSLTN